MSELHGRNFLRALFHVGQRMLRTGVSDQLMHDAITALVDAAEMLTTASEEAVLSIARDAFYLDRKMLAHASTEFHSLLGAMKRRKIDSVTILRGVTRQDLADLAALVVGKSSDLPAEGTVRINDRALASSDLDMRPMSGLRKTYAESLDALRGVRETRTLQLGEVLEVVDGFIAGSASDPGSSLIMATVHNHDEITYYHSVNVCLLSMGLGRFIGLSKDQIRLLGLSALLHDIGRVVVDETALQREGRLSNEDWAQVRLHPQEGALTIMAASGPGQELAAAVALEHHVRIDGGGYPSLKGRRPAMFSRLVGIIDAYDAITSHRPYRPARTPNEALRVLLDGAGTIHDPDLLRLFIEMMGHYPPGSLLRLAGGEVVMVVPSDDEGIAAVVVREPDGSTTPRPRPITFGAGEVGAQLLPDEAGIDPGSLLELVEQGEHAGR
ncbi:MAG: HD domain-containing phosphohydrolase [Actinomycetota bacterium]